VTAPARNDAWAVGASGGQPVVVNWNGRKWNAVTMPGAGGFQPSESTAVQAASAGNVWIFGGVATTPSGSPVLYEATNGKLRKVPARALSYYV
jgi:hypothetical protein